MSEKPKVAKFEVETARQLFLFGRGDGKRVLNPQVLADECGIHIETVRRHMHGWLKESEGLLAGASESGLAVSLSKETLKKHESDMLHLRKLLEINKFETNSLEKLTEKLEGLVEKFANTDEMERAIKLLDLWVRSCGQKSALQSQFLALQKQWTSLSGIVDLKDVEIVRAKEISKGKAKLEMRKIEQRDAVDSGELSSSALSFFESR
jgi:hypothetical protein